MVKFKKCNTFLMGFINNIYYLRSKKRNARALPDKTSDAIASEIVESQLCIGATALASCIFSQGKNNIFSEIFRDWGEKICCKKF